MFDSNVVFSRIKVLKERLFKLKDVFDVFNKKKRLEEVQRDLENPVVWQDMERAKVLGKERAALEEVIGIFSDLTVKLKDIRDLLELSLAEKDEISADESLEDLEVVEKKIEDLELQCMFSGAVDSNNAYLDIQAGSGGTEAQDWAEMLLRMYLRFGDRHEFVSELIELSPGEVAGIKSTTVKFSGSYAYGWLRTETGVHRLVRKSPFDAGNRRHTSFASVFVSPEIDDSIEIEVNPSDLRIDTYRAQGAGGQHVNKTDSAVRITHNPTGIVVQCQSERSQHKNRSQAMKQLRAKLYELELRKKTKEKELLEDTKKDITWGSQIRSYVLDDSRIKDLRTGFETRNPGPVLDGDLDMFIKKSLIE